MSLTIHITTVVQIVDYLSRRKSRRAHLARSTIHAGIRQCLLLPFVMPNRCAKLPDADVTRSPSPYAYTHLWNEKALSTHNHLPLTGPFKFKEKHRHAAPETPLQWMTEHPISVCNMDPELCLFSDRRTIPNHTWLDVCQGHLLRINSSLSKPRAFRTASRLTYWPKFFDGSMEVASIENPRGRLKVFVLDREKEAMKRDRSFNSKHKSPLMPLSLYPCRSVAIEFRVHSFHAASTQPNLCRYQ
ncbi:hypothetical protein F5Y13DRAFT_112620 [Hypoxylon sp. FL1857]|nr:hypothetical protein F5Y13DRAFT_112620 [Hypoxylon sp. FL1857]